jgi:hypothetical protein
MIEARIIIPASAYILYPVTTQPYIGSEARPVNASTTIILLYELLVLSMLGGNIEI